MKTTKQVINSTVYLFADAKSQYCIDNLQPGELPFEYEVRSYDYGNETCVRLMEFPITLTVPEGIDITLECIKNLKEKIVAVQDAADLEIADLNERIRGLALIEHQPDDE